MKLKPLLLLTAGIAGSFGTAGIILSLAKAPELNVVAEGEVANHQTTITSLPYTEVFGEFSQTMQQNMLVMPLTYPGVYCELEFQAFNEKHYNHEGHLIVAKMHSDGGMYNWFAIGMTAPKVGNRLYATKLDYNRSNPLNIVPFRDLKGIDVYMGEGNQVKLDKRTDGNYCNFTYSYDDENQKYSVRGDLTGRVDPFRWTFQNFSENDLLVIDKIVIHYNC